MRRRRRFTDLFLPPHALVSRRALRIVAALTVACIVLAGALARVLDPDEVHSVWDGVWWAAATVTTVGYGDVVPTDPAARAIALVLMFTGIGLVSILTASIASALLAEDVGDEERLIERQLAQLSDAIARLERLIETQSDRRDASS